MLRLLIALLRHRVTWRFLLVLTATLGTQVLLTTSVNWKWPFALYSLVGIKLLLMTDNRL